MNKIMTRVVEEVIRIMVGKVAKIVDKIKAMSAAG